MKQVQSIYYNTAKEIFGKITLHPKSVFKRAGCILVNDTLKSLPKGYRLVISTKELANPYNVAYARVDDISLFKNGDVINIDAKGEICWLYEIGSISNLIIPTERCNHRCIMCPQPPVSNEIDRTDFNLALIKLFDKNTREVGISGGEPTLIGDTLFDLIRQIKKSCPKAAISILSNGVKFADIDYSAKLAMCNHHDLQVDIPIFSDIASEHNRIVGAKTFYKTVQGLYNLALFGIQIGLRVVVHKQTYKRLPQLADYIYHNFPFVTQVAFMQMETIGLAETNLKDLWIDPYDYNNELEEAVMLLNERGITVFIYNAQLCILPEELRPFAQQSISEWKDIYLPICEGCSLKGECGGLFAANQKYHSKHIEAHKCYTPMPKPISLTEPEIQSNFLSANLDLIGKYVAKNDIVLDIPCGYGRNSIWLAERGYNVNAYDIDLEATKTLSEWCFCNNSIGGKINVIKGDVLHLDIKPGAFVLNVDLYSEELLQKMISLVKPGGIILIETPKNNGENHLELPDSGYISKILTQNGFQIFIYKECPKKNNKVSVKTIARKLS